MCGCLLSALYWGPGLKPRHVPWLGIEPETLWFAGWCSIHWSTPARVYHLFFIILYLYYFFHFSCVTYFTGLLCGGRESTVRPCQGTRGILRSWHGCRKENIASETLGLFIARWRTREIASSVNFCCAKRFATILCKSKCIVAEKEYSHSWIWVRLSGRGPGATTH